MNTKIYSVKILLWNILDEIVSKWIISNKTRDEISVIIRDKFIAHLEIFIENWFFEDWFRVKNLKWNVYEIRISLPQKYLLRIIFYFEYWKIILNTWFLVKTDKWAYDKKTKKEIEALYDTEIQKASNIFSEFNENSNDYICLDSYFNC